MTGPYTHMLKERLTKDPDAMAKLFLIVSAFQKIMIGVIGLGMLMFILILAGMV